MKIRLPMTLRHSVALHSKENLCVALCCRWHLIYKKRTATYLQHTATHCNTLLCRFHTGIQEKHVYRSVLQSAADCTSSTRKTLQHTATHCTADFTMQLCIAVCYSVLYTVPYLQETHCNTLQCRFHTAIHKQISIVLQCVVDGKFCCRSLSVAN